MSIQQTVSLYPSFEVSLYLCVCVCFLCIFRLSFDQMKCIYTTLFVCYPNKRVHCLGVAVFYDVFVDKKSSSFICISLAAHGKRKYCGPLVQSHEAID